MIIKYTDKLVLSRLYSTMYLLFYGVRHALKVPDNFPTVPSRAPSFIQQQDKVHCKQNDRFPITHMKNCKNDCVFHQWYYSTQIQFFTVMLCIALQIIMNCQVKKKNQNFMCLWNPSLSI